MKTVNVNVSVLFKEKLIKEYEMELRTLVHEAMMASRIGSVKSNITVNINGEDWFRKEAVDFLDHLEDEIPSNGQDSFDLVTLEKQMISFSEQIKITASNRRQKYQFWLVTDGRLPENDSEELEKAIERLEDASYDVSFIYFHEQSAEVCSVLSKWASNYFPWNNENIIQVFRQTFEASPSTNTFRLCLSDKVSIPLKKYTGSISPKTSIADKKVVDENKPVVQASNSRNPLFEDEEGDVYSAKQFPKNIQLGQFSMPLHEEHITNMKKCKIHKDGKGLEKDQIKILGFTSNTNLPIALLNEPTLFYGVSKCQIFSSLFTSCQIKEKIIVCSYMVRSGAPTLGFLTPVRNKNCFQLIPIPLQNEIGDIGEPEMTNPPTERNKETAQAYLNTLPLFNKVNDLPDPLQSCWSKAYKKVFESQGKTANWYIPDCPFTEPKKSNLEAFGLMASHGLHMNVSEAKIKAQKKIQLSKADFDRIVKDCKSGKNNPGTVAHLRQVCDHFSIPHDGKKKNELVDIIAKKA